MSVQPSPETFIIECNRKIASEEFPNMNSSNNEFTNIINPPCQIKQGDEIKVSNTFINEIGASSDILIFNNNDDPDNKTRMVYSFYAMDDGINQKRNSLDIAGKTANSATEWKTFNPIELMRYQPYAYYVLPSDVGNDPYPHFFADELSKLIQGVGNIYLDNAIWFPDEDRYLPSRFFAYLEIHQTKVTNDPALKYQLSIEPTTHIITIANKGGSQNANKLKNFIQKGMIVNVESDRVDLATANTNHLYLDGYYQVVDTRQWTSATNDFIKIAPIDPLFGGQHQVYSVYSYNAGTTTVGSTTLIMAPDPMWGNTLTSNMFISSNDNGFILNSITKITNVAPSTQVHANQDTINGFNTSGQNLIRIQDVTAVELYETISAPANTYIPNTAYIRTIIADTSPNRKAIAKHSSIQGDTDIKVETNDADNNASLVTTLFYNIEDDNDVVYNINTYSDTANNETAVHVDDYQRNSNKFFKCLPAPTGVIRVAPIANWVDGQNILFGTAGHFEDYSSFLTIGNKVADTFTSASQDYDQPMGSLYNVGYDSWIDISDDPTYSLTTHNPLHMIMTIGTAGLNQHEIQITDFRIDPIFGNPQVILHDPLPVPIGNVDDAGFGVIQHDFSIDGRHYAGQISPTEFLILVDDLYNMSGLDDGMFFISDIGNYLQFPAGTRITDIHHPQGYPPRLFQITLDTPTLTGTDGGVQIFPCRTLASPNINIKNPDGAGAGTIPYTGDLIRYIDKVKANKVISQTALNFAQISSANDLFNDANIYNGAVCSNVVANMPLDNPVVSVQNSAISVDGVMADYDVGVQIINFTNPTTGIIPAGTTLQIDQKCIADNTYITATNDNGWISMTLSKPLLNDFKAGRNAVKITRPYPNSGTLAMSENITTNIPTPTTLTFTTTHVNVTIDVPSINDLPPNTQLFVSAINVNHLTDSPINLTVKPKGFSYTTADSADLGDTRDYGMKWDDGMMIGDEVYQYIMSSRTNTGQIPNSNDNIATISDIPSLRVDGMKPRITVGSQNNNSIVKGTLGTILSSDTNIYITFNFSNADWTALFNNTSAIFNPTRGIAGYIVDPVDGNVEYIRIPNGTNDPHILPASTATKQALNSLHLTGIKRGVMNTEPRYYQAGTEIYLYDENVFNEDFMTTPNSEVHEFNVNGNQGYYNYDFSEGSTYFFSKTTPTEIANQCEGIIDGGNDSTTTLFDLEKNYNFSCMNYVTKKEWVKHYEYIDLDLGDNIHLSPSDVGSLITKQFHEPRNAKASHEGLNKLNIGSATSVARLGGLDIPESKNYIPHNRLYIPVWGSPVEEQPNKKRGVDYYSWYTGSATSVLRNEPYEYSFKFVNTYSNYALREPTTANYTNDDGSVVTPLPAGTLIEGEYDVHIRGSQLSIPNAYVPTLKSKEYPIDIYNGNGYNGYSHKSASALVTVMMGQMVGTNNLTMNYNVNTNRTELLFCHNPYTTPVSMTNNVVEGGDIATFVPMPPVFGHNLQRPFHAPTLSKTGGINIMNYSTEICDRGKYTPLTAFNTFNGVTTSKEHDMLNPFYDSSLRDKTNMENVGVKFWLKLGWTTDQLTSEIGQEINPITGFLTLKGTTQSEVDIADNQFFKEVPSTAQGDPLQTGNINGQSNFATGSMGGYELGIGGDAPQPASGSTDAKKGTQFLKALNNTRTGYNLPSTSGTPMLFYDPTQHQDPQGVIITNPDFWLFTGYSVLSDGSSALQAKFLPEKTDTPYFLLFCPELSSNNNFYTSKNKGSIDPECIAVVSKLNVSQDYYFAYQSPITFYAKSDFTLSKITTRILAPNKTIPKNLGDASSVIYSITRYNPQPISMKPTITEIQDNYMTNMIQMEKMKDQMNNQGEHQTELQKVNSLIESISESVLTPDENQASIITGILEQANQFGLFNMDRGQMRDFVVNHPMAVGFMNMLGHVQNWGFAPRQPIAETQIQNVGRNEDEIITGMPVANTDVRPLGELLDMPFEPAITQPNTPIVQKGVPNPQEISDALTRAVYEESLIKGEATSLKERLGRGQPREIGFVTNPKPEYLTPTAELFQRARDTGQVMGQENPYTTTQLTAGGLGRQQFNNARLALANKIAQKHSQLTEMNLPQQYLPSTLGQGEGTVRPRNLTEQEAKEFGTLRDHRQHEAQRSAGRSAPPTYRTRETASVAPTYESFTSGNPFYKHHSDYEPSTIPPSYRTEGSLENIPE